MLTSCSSSFQRCAFIGVRGVRHRSWRSQVNGSNLRRAFVAAGAPLATRAESSDESFSQGNLSVLLAMGVFATYFSTQHATECEEQKLKKKKISKDHHWTPAEVAVEKFDEVIEAHNIDNLPVYTSDQVAENDGQDGKRVWMSYGGIVYDVTDFIQNHPGGDEKIMMAAGSVSVVLSGNLLGS